MKRTLKKLSTLLDSEVLGNGLTNVKNSELNELLIHIFIFDRVEISYFYYSDLFV